MGDTMIFLIFMYTLISVVLFVGTVVPAISFKDPLAARVALTAWIWPIVAIGLIVYGMIYGIVRLYRIATEGD